jgi:hypothetical protein
MFGTIHATRLFCRHAGVPLTLFQAPQFQERLREFSPGIDTESITAFIGTQRHGDSVAIVIFRNVEMPGNDADPTSKPERIGQKIANGSSLKDSQGMFGRLQSAR